jgi:hypothetical protein
MFLTQEELNARFAAGSSFSVQYDSFGMATTMTIERPCGVTADSANESMQPFASPRGALHPDA